MCQAEPSSASDPTAEAKALGCGLPHSAPLMANSNRSRAAGNAARDALFHSVVRDSARDFPMGFTREITFDPIYFLMHY